MSAVVIQLLLIIYCHTVAVIPVFWEVPSVDVYENMATTGIKRYENNARR